MKRLLFLVLLILCIIAPLTAAQHISVPVDHRVYQVLANAELRGLIERQVAVKPYSADRILNLLSQIESQSGTLARYEAEDLKELKQELQRSYGKEPSSFDDIFSTGFFRTYDEEKDMGASMGVRFTTLQTGSLSLRQYDSRNSATAFLRGDLGQNISYNMDFGLTVDKLNSNVFLPTEFTIPGEGFYNQLLQGGHQLRDIPGDAFYTGLTVNPELSASFFDGSVQLRWGTVKRDWGPGLNNIMLSGSARTFDGIDVQIDFAPWLHYAAVNGSLAKFSLNTLDGEEFFSDDYQQDKPYYRFDNNYSGHRVEVDFTKNFTLGIYEAMVWQKRFELSYINPLTVYMFQQNNQGDIDDMIAGIDFTYQLNKTKFYGSMGMTEMNVIGNPITMLKAARNMFAFQAGFVTPLPVGTFSTLTVQWTYIAPFFYAHYPILEHTGVLVDATDYYDEFDDVEDLNNDGIVDFDDIIDASQPPTEFKTTSDYENDFILDTVTNLIKKNYNSTTGKSDWEIDVSGSATSWTSPDGRTEIEKVGNEYHIYETAAETAYVNKGENLGYPLDPNSQELLVQVDLGLPKGWTAQVQAKYQARSGQYGYTVEQFMDYGDHRNYDPKEFWANTFKHTFSLLFKGTKKLTDMPIELIGSYRFTSVWERPITTPGSFDGRNTGFGSWDDPVFDHIVQVGARIFL
ncbi:MAG: hypothetical protein EOM32_05820 [Spirochaetia bacterium]|nr:hypothetical protein [Spirochaetia bacterium]